MPEGSALEPAPLSGSRTGSEEVRSQCRVGQITHKGPLIEIRCDKSDREGSMYLLTTSTYPDSQANEIAARFQKAVATPLPAFLKRTHTLICSSDNGMKVVGLYEAADDKFADAYRELVRYFVQYHDIQGFNYTIEPMLSAQEAIPLLRR
jgi:hypothetical protein